MVPEPEQRIGHNVATDDGHLPKTYRRNHHEDDAEHHEVQQQDKRAGEEEAVNLEICLTLKHRIERKAEMKTPRHTNKARKQVSRETSMNREQGRENPKKKQKDHQIDREEIRRQHHEETALGNGDAAFIASDLEVADARAAEESKEDVRQLVAENIG